MDVTEQADRWVRLRLSQVSEEHQEAAWADMPTPVWLDILHRYPEMAEWVAHAKRSPAEVVALLARHPDARVREWVAAQRRLAPELRVALARDADEDVRRAASRFLDRTPTDG